MPGRVRRLDHARWVAARSLVAVGDELREARLQTGLTILEISHAVGISPAQISRIERGILRHVAYETLAVLAAAVGLELSLRAYPAGEPVRDRAQLALLARFRARVPDVLGHRAEVPLGIPRDLRAWDDMVIGARWSIKVDAESRLRDVQALHRRLAVKMRDGHEDRVILLVADTRHNRHVLRLASSEFQAAFPVRGRDALAAFDRCERPPGSAVILL